MTTEKTTASQTEGVGGEALRTALKTIETAIDLGLKAHDSDGGDDDSTPFKSAFGALEVVRATLTPPETVEAVPGASDPAPATDDRERLVEALRAAGWMVAVHNDYRLNGEAHTFWLWTKGDRAVKGEGRTDAEALEIVARAALTTEASR